MSMRREIRVKAPVMQRDECNRLLDTVGNSITWITLAVLESHAEDAKGRGFESLKKVNNFFDYVQEEKSHWDDEDDTAELVRIARRERPWIYEGVMSIPFSQLLKLAGIDNKRGNSTKNPHMKAYIQTALIIVLSWCDEVLKKHYKVNKENRIDYLAWVIDWIDSYYKGFYDEKDINQMFIEEIGYDMKKGEKVG